MLDPNVAAAAAELDKSVTNVAQAVNEAWDDLRNFHHEHLNRAELNEVQDILAPLGDALTEWKRKAENFVLAAAEFAKAAK